MLGPQKARTMRERGFGLVVGSQARTRAERAGQRTSLRLKTKEKSPLLVEVLMGRVKRALELQSERERGRRGRGAARRAKAAAGGGRGAVLGGLWRRQAERRSARASLAASNSS